MSNALGFLQEKKRNKKQRNNRYELTCHLLLFNAHLQYASTQLTLELLCCMLRKCLNDNAFRKPKQLYDLIKCVSEEERTKIIECENL